MLMILLIARRDKCDLIFRRQLLSCFVSLRSFQRVDNNYSAELSLSSFFFFLFTFLTREEQNTNATKWFLSLFFHKFIKSYLLLEKDFCFPQHLTLRLHTRPVTKLHQTFLKTLGMDTSLHTSLYKETLKVQVIVIDSCTACITFHTEKPSTIFFFYS